MIMVGADIVSLYPNLNVDQVVLRIEEEVKVSKIKFENIDYLEATRYIALNWSQEDCRKSPIRRVLPWRRGKRGTKPGITGSDPRSGNRGDQEQWEFPRVVLEEWEKKQIVAYDQDHHRMYVQETFLQIWGENVPPGWGRTHRPQRDLRSSQNDHANIR